MAANTMLEFERPIVEMEQKIDELRKMSDTLDIYRNKQT